MNAARYEVCYYRDSHLVHAVGAETRAQAEMAALDGFRERLVVSIYRDGKALKGWLQRARP
jgi:hypothetical protein